jgi:hypothetical protein
MDTTCLVGIQHTDGQVEYISVKWNGLGVGSVLYQHYHTREKVLELIHQGSRPYLEDPEEIIEDDMEMPQMISSYHSFFKLKLYRPSYYYLFTLDNVWTVYHIEYESPVQLKYMLM